jgi:hypothetical protein
MHRSLSKGDREPVLGLVGRRSGDPMGIETQPWGEGFFNNEDRPCYGVSITCFVMLQFILVLLDSCLKRNLHSSYRQGSNARHSSLPAQCMQDPLVDGPHGLA